MGNLTDHFAGGSGGGGNLLEQLSFICDGRTVTGVDGTVYTSDTAVRTSATTSLVKWSGSQIAYKPPENTKTVLYEFTASIGHQDTAQLGHVGVYVDGTLVNKSRRSFYGSITYSSFEPIYCALEVGAATESIADGKIGSWTSNKTIEVRVREYSTSYEFFTNDLNYWNGVGSNEVQYPVLTITALS